MATPPRRDSAGCAAASPPGALSVDTCEVSYPARIPKSSRKPHFREVRRPRGRSVSRRPRGAQLGLPVDPFGDVHRLEANPGGAGQPPPPPPPPARRAGGGGGAAGAAARAPPPPTRPV